MGSSDSSPTVCDTVAPFANFDAEAYMGNWYVIQKSWGARFDSDFFYGTQADYSNLNAETATFDVTNTAYVWPIGFSFDVSGTAVDRGDGQISVGLRRTPA